MQRRSDPLSRAQHRTIGGDLFNYTWSHLAQKDRTKSETDEKLHAAHASRYHWGRAGTPRNVSIGEWQISRVYSVLGRSEPALYHGRRALEIARRSSLGSFYVAYAYEAMVRAAAAAEESREKNRYLPGGPPNRRCDPRPRRPSDARGRGKFVPMGASLPFLVRGPRRNHE